MVDALGFATLLHGSYRKRRRKPTMEPHVYSPEELAKHDGTDESLSLLICVKGIVFDVSSSREFYGPGALNRLASEIRTKIYKAQTLIRLPLKF
jgi:cytochrome b involved in lipid metabolism